MNRHAVLSMVAHSPTSIFKIRKFHKFRDGEVIPTHTRHLTHVAIFSHPSFLVLPGAKKIKHSINTPLFLCGKPLLNMPLCASVVWQEVVYYFHAQTSKYLYCYIQTNHYWTLQKQTLSIVSAHPQCRNVAFWLWQNAVSHNSGSPLKSLSIRTDG